MKNHTARVDNCQNSRYLTNHIIKVKIKTHDFTWGNSTSKT